MADNTPNPQFLGGGPKFNRAGAQPPASEPVSVPDDTRAGIVRRLITAIVVVILLGLLYWVSTSPNGMTHVGGHGGVSPVQHSSGPERDIAP